MTRQIIRLVVFLFAIVLFTACGDAAGMPGARAQTPVPAPVDAIMEDDGMISKTAPVKVDKSQFKLANEISSPTWINSETLNWADLRGKVVVVDFWTFACYNCKNTLPYLKAWDEKYRAQGLVVLGVHTPELSFEKDVENVRKAVADYNIKYPVAIDGDFANWNRYNVWAWPTWYIVDKEGYIRYTHVGEGDYNGSEKVIQQLLAE